jgi:hypothetical protein
MPLDTGEDRKKVRRMNEFRKSIGFGAGREKDKCLL